MVNRNNVLTRLKEKDVSETIKLIENNFANKKIIPSVVITNLCLCIPELIRVRLDPFVLSFNSGNDIFSVLVSNGTLSVID